MDFNSEFKTFLSKINTCQTMADIRQREKSLTRLYEAGIFTEKQLAALDGEILARYDMIASELEFENGIQEIEA